MTSENLFLENLSQHKRTLDEPIIYNKLVKYNDPERKSQSNYKKNAPAHWYYAFQFEDGNIWAKHSSFSTSSDPETIIFNSYGEKPLTPERLEQLKKYQEKIKIDLEQEQKNRIKHGQEESQKIWNQASPTLPENFEWLSKKKIPGHNLRFSHDSLLVPAYNLEKTLSSLQQIKSDGSKLNLPGAPMKNLFCPIGDINNSSIIYVTEGYSDAATAVLATNQSACCAFGSYNIVNVGSILKTLYPNKSIIMLQDNNEAGQKAASIWKALIKTEVIAPDGASDFNDLYIKFGIEEVKRQLQERFLPISSFDSFFTKKHAPLEWVIENFLLKGIIGAVYGHAGAGKTTFLLELALCIANGIPFMQKPLFSASRVLYVDAELGEPLLANTFSFLLKNRSHLYPKKNLDILCVDSVEGKINLKEDLWKRKFDQAFENYDVIILDNYLKLSPTVKYDEQHIIWECIFDWLKPWAKKKGKTILFGHHSDKTGIGMRGAGDMMNDLDFTLGLKQNENKPPYLSIQATFASNDKARGIHSKYKAAFQCDFLDDHWLVTEPEKKIK